MPSMFINPSLPPTYLTRFSQITNRGGFIIWLDVKSIRRHIYLKVFTGKWEPREETHAE